MAGVKMSDTVGDLADKYGAEFLDGVGWTKEPWESWLSHIEERCRHYDIPRDMAMPLAMVLWCRYDVPGVVRERMAQGVIP